MSAWEALLWGLLGSGVAEALNLSAMMRPTGSDRRWRRPWRRRSERPWVAAAVGLRLFVGGALAAALGASGQLPTPLGAFLSGLAAPLIVARFFAAVPLEDSPAEAVSTRSPPAVLEPAPAPQFSMPDDRPRSRDLTGRSDGSGSGQAADGTS